MIDINTIPGDYGLPLDKVGFIKVKHHMIYKTCNGEQVKTDAKFSILTKLDSGKRGVHMSRPVRMLDYFDTVVYSDDDIVNFLSDMMNKCETDEVYFEMEYEHKQNKTAPITGITGYSYYNVVIKKTLHRELGLKENIVTLIIPVTTSCACSKAISDYSSHNQRAFVTINMNVVKAACIEEMIALVESSSSCPIYPVLKRADEKYVTETVYDNPNIVEDLARSVAGKLRTHQNVKSFCVKCRIEESILPYDSYAEVLVENNEI